MRQLAGNLKVLPRNDEDLNPLARELSPLGQGVPSIATCTLGADENLACMGRGVESRYREKLMAGTFYLISGP